ncbi:MAG: TRAP transporter small permease subunit [Thiolinea sp.]
MANGAALIGISVAIATGTHLRPRLLDHLVPERWSPTITRISFLVSALVMAGVLSGHAAGAGKQGAGFYRATAVVPIWIAQLALPYGFASAALRLTFGVHPELASKEVVS